MRALFDRAVAALRDEALARGRELQWTLFERYDLAQGEKPGYAALATEFSLTSGQFTGNLAQMRAAFRAQAVAALEALCVDRDEFRREARDLWAAWRSSDGLPDATLAHLKDVGGRGPSSRRSATCPRARSGAAAWARCMPRRIPRSRARSRSRWAGFSLPERAAAQIVGLPTASPARRG